VRPIVVDAACVIEKLPLATAAGKQLVFTGAVG
jgi:hypothetical protein